MLSNIMLVWLIVAANFHEYLHNMSIFDYKHDLILLFLDAHLVNAPLYPKYKSFRIVFWIIVLCFCLMEIFALGFKLI
jgi:hypothetical protein